jgi:hypothetical protein
MYMKSHGERAVPWVPSSGSARVRKEWNRRIGLGSGRAGRNRHRSCLLGRRIPAIDSTEDAT